MKAGDKVNVDILKNGFYTKTYKDAVIEVKDQKVKVETWQNGKRWYSRNNVTLINPGK